MKVMTDLVNQALSEGIDRPGTVRLGLIVQRNKALAESDFEMGALLSHAIWWLDKLRTVVES